MNLKNQIREALGLSKSYKLEAEGKLADGTIIVSDTAFEAGANVMILAEDGTTMPWPVGEYELEDGSGLTVTEEGIISEVYEVEVEEEVDADKEKEEYEEEEAPAADVAEEAVTEVVEEVVSATDEIAIAIDEATGEEVTPEIAQQAAEIAVAIVEEKAEEVSLSKEMRTVLSIIRKELNKETKKVTPVRKSFKKAKPDGKPVQSKKFSSKKRNKVNTVSAGSYKAMTTKERYLHNIGN